ncbi:MAG: RNA methyltransferase [Gammaproteobacteria bacterium]|jgi:23S rRNA (guanosine2251-2'-O)-methyltransferase|nr:RNA methyltransferase [Gammaproteobacteria bacterium]
MTDSALYTRKKARFSRMLTVYGRKPALEALRDESLGCHALHLADNNREGGIIAELTAEAARRGVEVIHHSRAELARISKNGKQDQGVAVDIACPGFRTLEDFLPSLLQDRALRLLALDGISNPANLGMIVRSAAAGQVDGIIWSPRGNAALGPLVIKASAGTLYRAPLVIAGELPAALRQCRENGAGICILDANATTSLFDYRPARHCVYVLGNETEGVSAAVRELADTALSIPMANGVESLNVAVTASLIAYAGLLGASGKSTELRPEAE